MNDHSFSRRSALKTAAAGFGYAALAGLASQEAQAARNPLQARKPHFAPKAKRVIFMFMQGGPSHIDTFDHKPELEKMHGKSMQGTYQGRATSGKLMKSPYKFNQHGESGLPISELFPELSKHADDLCIINGMHTDNAAHPQATIMAHTGSFTFVRPSVGAWTLYGLGTENQDLPGFITINPLTRLGGAQNYGSAFLPAAYQGTPLTTAARGLPNLSREGVGPNAQRKHLDLIQSMNRDLLTQSRVDTEIDAVIESYELAFRMQSAVPDVLDLAGESVATKQKYGINQNTTRDFGSQCLMARRLAEAGVRFIELSKSGWDQHNGIKTNLQRNCAGIDKPIAALITDLKERGMLDETLIVWGGEFGRTPVEQNNFNGRRHNNRGYSMWMCGGGVQGGTRVGSTDPTGWEATENKVHTHDFHATMLHLLGFDHEKLTYRYAGRDFRLTDVHGRVVKEITG